MFTPKQLALSAIIAAALGTTAYAQQSPTPNSTSDRSSATAPASPSATDRNTADKADRGAKNRDRSAKNDSNDLKRSDRKFVEKVARNNQAELELAKIAEQKAGSQEVKDFAKHMVDDHTKAGEELKSAVASKDAKVPTDLDRSHKRLADQLNKMQGQDFDRKYMSEMVSDHEKTLKELQKEAKDAKDPALKSFAEKTASTVQQHLDMARKVADQVGATRGGRGNRSARATGTTPTDANTGANAPKADSKANASMGSSTSSTQRNTPATKDDKKQ
jgi:putative membrane protein